MTASPPPFTRQDADALLKAGRPAEAIPILRALVANTPAEDSHLLALAWALHDSGRRVEATACFERLFAGELSRRLFTGFAYDELVRIYREGGQWEKLLAVCERAVASQPEDPGLRFTLGEAQLAAGLPQAAAAVFDQLTALEADRPEIWCALGEAQLAAGDPLQAEAAYERAAALDPALAPAFFHRLACGLLRDGRLAEARTALSRCLALRPDEPLYRTALGDLCLCTGEIEAAQEAYAAAATLQPSGAGGFWNRLGNRLQEKGMLTEAIVAFHKAALAEPGNPRYLLRLATLYADQGLAEAALATLRQAERLGGDEGR